MANLINDKVKAEIRAALGQLKAPVRLVLFTQKNACGACAEQQALLKSVASLSRKLKLEVRELVADAAEARRLGIDKVPATAIIGEQDHGIRFYGLTAGYELPSLIEAVLMVSIGNDGLEPGVEAVARAIEVPVHLEVMVTLTCPYCPRMVHLAHQLAFANPLVRADMIDSSEFPTLVERYHVTGVPRTVINGRATIDGALAAESAALEILRNVDPAAYERVEAALREARGERLAVPAEPEVEYEMIVVGAGPAGLTAALYAVRKGRRVAIIGKQVGGQIKDTATIENWPGVPEIGGRELGERFRDHVESYQVAGRYHVQIARVRRSSDGFEVEATDGTRFRGQSVIYAAGKQYRRLGVAGEERFIGRGVAFCATCDAPLFRDKRVAVVGGGNSALTAVRDLHGFARQIHVVQNLPQLTADPVLVRQVEAMKNTSLHLGMEVHGYLGDETLTGIRLASADGEQRYDLAVDGVFLEIGLVPNSEAVRELLELNPAGEIPVERDGSTRVPGLFAAGDVTDDPDKQVVIAAGAGARAALAADRYLSELDAASKLGGTAK